MKKSDLKKIVTDKGVFLAYTQVNIDDALTKLNMREKAIQAMPTRGYVQRDNRRKAFDELAVAHEKLAAKLGNSCLNTFRFVGEHRELLPTTLRKKLFR